MYTDEVERELEGCDKFHGVFLADTVPTKMRPGGIILNLDSSSEPGSHWIAFWKNDDGSGEYFDSFGNHPPFGAMVPSLRRLCKSRIIYSKLPLQHETSSSCGLYCIFFIKHKCIGLSFSNILSHFSRSRGLNEIIVSVLSPLCE